jgi:hypothetical protein
MPGSLPDAAGWLLMSPPAAAGGACGAQQCAGSHGRFSIAQLYKSTIMLELIA